MNKNRLKKFQITNEKIRFQFFYLLFIISIPVFILTEHLNDRENILNSFNDNKELICIINEVKINVSKKDNWIYKKPHFIKGDSEIVTTRCSLKD